MLMMKHASQIKNHLEKQRHGQQHDHEHVEMMVTIGQQDVLELGGRAGKQGHVQQTLYKPNFKIDHGLL